MSDRSENPIKRIVGEIHRRSLWQVLSVYLVGSWGALQVVDLLTDNYGLPGWVPPFALVLLVIGLPIVLATAVVQEGAPSGKTWSGPDSSPSDSPALLEGEPHPVFSDRVSHNASDDEPDPGSLRRLFNWRNAVLGGLAAALLLATAVGAYFFMWSAGIGPVGSLVAQGVIDDREQVVLAEFENSTSDSTLGAVVTDAFRVDLVRSPVLAVVEPTFVSQVLRRMGRDRSERLTAQVAREVAQREGIKAVVQGEVAATGSRYVLTTSLVAADGGETLAAFRETAEGPEEIIDAIDRLSQRLREKAGESLPSIKQGEPLRTVTTGSLDALRLYSRALREQEEGDRDRAVALLEEAVTVDPEFAMAHRKLGAIHRNRGRWEEATEAITRAYELRDRLTDRERHLATATYHQFVTRDRERTVQAYRNVLDVHPDDGIALNNLGVHYGDDGEFERASDLYRQAVRGPGETVTAHGNLIETLVNLGRVQEAQEAAERFEERYGPENPAVRYRTAWRAAHAGELPKADSVAAVSLRDSDVPVSDRVYIMGERAVLDGAVGRFREAEAHLDAARRLALGRELLRHASWIERLRAWMLTVRSGAGEALAEYHRRMSPEMRTARDSVPRALIASARLYAYLGRADSARARLDRLPSGFGDNGSSEAVQLTLARADIARAKGRPVEAIEGYRRAMRDAGCHLGCGLLGLAEAHDDAERPDSAAALYEEWLGTHDWDRLYQFLIERGPALERLCSLHAELGNLEKAAERCREFAEVWANADPELRPRVRRARERAAALGSP